MLASKLRALAHYLGENTAWSGAGSCGCQFAVSRNVANSYFCVRCKERNVLNSWMRIAAGDADSAGTFSGNQTISGSLIVSGTISGNCPCLTLLNWNII